MWNGHDPERRKNRTPSQLIKLLILAYNLKDIDLFQLFKFKTKMKKILFSTLILTVLITSCKSENKKEESTNSETTSPAVTEKTAITKKNDQSLFSIDEILNSYLKIKNALVKDDSKEATNASKELYTLLNSENTIEAKFKNEFETIAKEAKLHTESISANAEKIESQREQFALLSQNMNALIKIFGTDKELYQDYCPMFDQGKSGYWISETKDIQNPYYGAEMLTCGRIESELK